MTRDMAFDVINRVKDEMGEGLLETMMYMYDNLNDFELEEQNAFRIVYRDFRKLFEPAGGY